MSEAIISVSNLGKKYRLSHQGERQRYTALRDVIAEKAKGLFRKIGERKVKNGEAPHSPHSSLPSSRSTSEDFWALREVSFEVRQGEVVGIIGRNGAGKSTLLKILSRITEPTEGRVHIKGRVASLLEVGTGFHPELTGRENIFLNGAILGMSRVEIRKKFDEIVAFAEVEKFLDTPVKRYSSGMYVRLAFAVAAHLQPEILIVDEVLAVGDAEFQKKCLGKMGETAKSGRTVLFVSHNMAAITKLCQKGLLFDHGILAGQGNMTAVVAEYLHSDKADTAAFRPDSSKGLPGNDIIRLLSVCVVGENGEAGPTFGSDTPIQVEIVYSVLKAVRGLRVGFYLLSSDGAVVFTAIDTDPDGLDALSHLRPNGIHSSCCFIPHGFLNRGQYSITVGSDSPMTANFRCENVISFCIEPTGSQAAQSDNRPGFICPNLRWNVHQLANTILS